MVKVSRARLTESWKSNPLHTGEKVKYRPSKGASDTFARITALPTQIARAKACKGHDAVELSLDRPRTLQATISIPLGATHDVADWASQLMETLAAKSLVVLTRAKDDEKLGIREWRPLLDFEGKFAGKILVQCSDESELRRLHGTLHGKQVNIGEHSTALGVHSDFTQLRL